MTPQEQIDHERQLAEILKIRGLEKGPSSRLSTWLSSPVLATVLGVVGTGVLGAWVSSEIQDRAKRNELDRSSQEQRLSAQNAVVSKVLTLVGESMSSTEDLLVSVNNSYSEEGRSKDERDKLRKWKVQLTERRDAADLAWRREKGSIGYTILYLFDDNKDVNSAWGVVTREADDFERCTNQWYSQNAATGSDEAVADICNSDRKAFEDAVEGFMTVVTAHRVAPQVK